MNKKHKTAFLLGLTVITALALAGCGAKETTAPLQISADTTFQQILHSDGLFRAVFVWPLARIVNFFTGLFGPVAAIIIIAVLVNLIIFALSYRNSVGVSASQIKFAPYRKEYKNSQQVEMYQEMQKVYKHYNASARKTLIFEVIQIPIVIALYMAINSAAAIAESSFFGIQMSTPTMVGIVLRNPVYILIFVGMLLTQLFVAFAPVVRGKRTIANSFNPSSWLHFFTVFFFGLSLPVFVSVYYAVFNVISIIKSWIIVNHAQKLVNNDQWTLPQMIHMDTVIDAEATVVEENSKEDGKDDALIKKQNL